jgi:hypothetical protein
MYPQSNIVRYEVPARGEMGPVKIHVYDNADLRPDIMKEAEKKYETKFSEDWPSLRGWARSCNGTLKA